MPTLAVNGIPRPPLGGSTHIAPGRTRLILAVLLAGAASCSDSTTPKSMSVAISVAGVSGPDVSIAADSLPLVSCGVTLNATASGTDTATWQGGTVRWYVGVDRSVPFDTLMVTASDVRLVWGNKQIGAGQTQTSNWTVSAGAPFHAEMEYEYQPAHGDLKSAKAGFDCGAQIPPGTPAPVIDTIVLQSGPNSVQPGNTLVVDYTVTSPVGVLQTAIVLSGPCTVQEAFPEQLQTKLTRSARIVIPTSCQLGVPVTLTVYARDGGLQVSSRVLATQIPLADLTPPYLQVTVQPRVLLGGDSIPVHVVATDNRELAALVWDVLPAGTGVRDSLMLTGQGTSNDFYVHLLPGATGNIQLRLYARDAVGLVSDTTITQAGLLPVVSGVSLPTVTVRAPGAGTEVIPDPRRQLAYLLEPESTPVTSAQILVLSLSTMTVTQAIALPGHPDDFDLTPGGDSLIVTLDGAAALGVIDLRQSPLTVSLLPLNPFDSTNTPRPMFVRTLSNGRVFVSTFNPYRLDEVDLTTGAQRLRREAGNPDTTAVGDVQTAWLARSLDHSVVVVNGADFGFQRYDVATDQFGPRLTSTLPNNPLALDSTGRYIAVRTTVYDASLLSYRQLASLQPANRGVLSADGATLYVTLNGIIAECRVSDGMIVDAIRPPSGSVYGDVVRISDDGTLLAAAMQPGGGTATQVSVIKLH
ncbi:MAG TPA: hypothetical protein VF737_11805 [Gemmatimonadaceae bacterium]